MEQIWLLIRIGYGSLDAISIPLMLSRMASLKLWAGIHVCIISSRLEEKTKNLWYPLAEHSSTILYSLRDTTIPGQPIAIPSGRPASANRRSRSGMKQQVLPNDILPREVKEKVLSVAGRRLELKLCHLCPMTTFLSAAAWVLTFVGCLKGPLSISDVSQDTWRKLRRGTCDRNAVE